MAKVYIGVDQGTINTGPGNLTVSASSTGLDVELVIDVAAAWKTLALEQAVQAFLRYIEDGRFRPTGGV